MPLTPEERKLITFEGFESAFQQFLGETASNQDAYERAEALVEEAIGQRLFSSYDSFRMKQSRRMAMRSEQRQKEKRMNKYLRSRF